MTRLLWVVVIAMLAARMTGAHVHVCVDGQEPPVTLHVEDLAGQHSAQHSGQPHNDIDVSVVTEASLKKADDAGGPDVLPLVAAVVLLLIAPPFTRTFLPKERRVRLPPFPAFFLPPAHAPPR